MPENVMEAGGHNDGQERVKDCVSIQNGCRPPLPKCFAIWARMGTREHCYVDNKLTHTAASPRFMRTVNSSLPREERNWPRKIRAVVVVNTLDRRQRSRTQALQCPNFGTVGFAAESRTMRYTVYSNTLTRGSNRTAHS